MRTQETLRPEDRERLKRARDRLGREEERYRSLVVQMIDAGISAAAIARELGITRQAVYGFVKRARAL